jgi:transposase
MARPYSLDLRERVVAAVVAGLTCREVAAMFSIGAATVVRWAKRAREIGSPAALPMGGKRRFALAPHRDWVLTRVSEQPDTTLRALTAELAERGVAVSSYGVWHFLKREGISFKKKPARRRARPTRCGAATVAMAEPSGQA